MKNKIIVMMAVLLLGIFGFVKPAYADNNLYETDYPGYTDCINENSYSSGFYLFALVGREETPRLYFFDTTDVYALYYMESSKTIKFQFPSDCKYKVYSYTGFWECTTKESTIWNTGGQIAGAEYSSMDLKNPDGQLVFGEPLFRQHN